MSDNIANDIAKIASYWTDVRGFSEKEVEELIAAAHRVEAWLATHPEHV